MRSLILCSLASSQCTISGVYISIFDASFIVPVFLLRLFFVNLVFPVLGNSLLRSAVFHVLSSTDKNKDESYRDEQEHQFRISNKSLLWSLV